MKESFTFKLIDEILDVAGLGKPRLMDEVLNSVGLKRLKGIEERLREIETMPTDEFNGLADDILLRNDEYYRKNLTSVEAKLASMKGGPKAYYFGSLTPLAGRERTLSDWFLRKACFYYDKIVLENDLESLLKNKAAFGGNFMKRHFVFQMMSFALYRPWAEHGVVEVLRTPILGQGYPTLLKIADDDFDFESKAHDSPYLRIEDIDLEGEAAIRHLWSGVFESLFSIKLPLDDPKTRNFILSCMIGGASANLGSAILGSLATGSCPSTDLRCSWRLLGYWIARRTEELVNQGKISKKQWNEMLAQAKAGMAWMSSEIKELVFVPDLPVKRTLEIRESTNYSSGLFRDDLGKATREIEVSKEGSMDELKRALEQEMEKVRGDAKNLKDDLDAIGATSATAAGIGFMSMMFGLAPISLGSLVTALGIPTATYLIQEGRLKKKSGYFLLELQREKELLETLKSHGVLYPGQL
jgi:hypothetical protein